MAVAPYSAPSVGYDNHQVLSSHSACLSVRNLLQVLGDFWVDYFQDVDALLAFQAGTTSMISQEYLLLLDRVLRSNIHSSRVHPEIRHKLLVLSSDVAETVYLGTAVDYVDIEVPGLFQVEYLVSSLFEPVVVLKRGEHFELVGGKLRFQVDLFRDEAILRGVYSAESEAGDIHLSLWATDVLLDEATIYDRFGRFLYLKEQNSTAYHAAVEALQFLYTNAKSILNLERALNSLIGLPYCRTHGGVVTGISSSAEVGTVISTTVGQYTAPGWVEIIVSEGQTLSPYQLMARAHYVKDWLTDPDWYDGATFPRELVEYFNIPGMTDAEAAPLLYDGTMFYDGTQYYDGYDGSSGVILTSSSTGTGTEQELYAIMDGVLKYNLVYFVSTISLENYRQGLEDAYGLSALVRKGTPIYLHPVVDVGVTFDPNEVVPEASDLLQADLVWDDQDILGYATYDGTYFYNNTLVYNNGIVDTLDIYVTSNGITDYFTGDDLTPIVGRSTLEGHPWVAAGALPQATIFSNSFAHGAALVQAEMPLSDFYFSVQVVATDSSTFDLFAFVDSYTSYGFRARFSEGYFTVTNQLSGASGSGVYLLTDGDTLTWGYSKLSNTHVLFVNDTPFLIWADTSEAVLPVSGSFGMHDMSTGDGFHLSSIVVSFGVEAEHLMDESGNLILDEFGNPILAWGVAAGYLADELGNLILDEFGNQIQA